jgi:AcrR family transcriptional regulator
MVHVNGGVVKGAPGDPRRAGAPDGRKLRWQEHNRVRRGEFVTAAITAIRRDGPQVGLDGICEVAGVTKPVLYRHFRDKADLFAAVLQQIASEVFLPRIAAELDPAQGDQEMLRAAIGAYVDLVVEEPQLYRFVFTHNALGDRGDFVASMEEAVARALMTLMEQRLALAGADPRGAEPWAYGVVGMTQLATHRWVDNPTMGAGELTDLLVSLAWQGLAGVLPPPDAPPAGVRPR